LSSNTQTCDLLLFAVRKKAEVRTRKMQSSWQSHLYFAYNSNYYTSQKENFPFKSASQGRIKLNYCILKEMQFYNDFNHWVMLAAYANGSMSCQKLFKQKWVLQISTWINMGKMCQNQPVDFVWLPLIQFKHKKIRLIRTNNGLLWTHYYTYGLHKTAGNFFTSWAIISFSRTTLLRVVGWLVGWLVSQSVSQSDSTERWIDQIRLD